MEKSRLVLPSLEEVRAARRELKKEIEVFSGWAQGSLPKSLRASNLKLEAEKIKEKLAIIQKSINASNENYKKRIKKYRKEILSGCELWDLGKFVKKLEKTERKVSRLCEEEKKLGKLRRRFEKILERLDRASDVITFLSSEKFMLIVASALEKEFSKVEAPLEKRERESSSLEEVISDRVADALQNAEKMDGEEERSKENSIMSEDMLIGEPLVDSIDTSAGVTEILWTESEITRHREISAATGPQDLKSETAPTQRKQARAYGGGRNIFKYRKECAERLDPSEDWPNASKRRAERDAEKRDIIRSYREDREERDTEIRRFLVKFGCERNYVPLQPFDPGGAMFKPWFTLGRGKCNENR